MSKQPRPTARGLYPQAASTPDAASGRSRRSAGSPTLCLLAALALAGAMTGCQGAQPAPTAAVIASPTQPPIAVPASPTPLSSPTPVPSPAAGASPSPTPTPLVSPVPPIAGFASPTPEASPGPAGSPSPSPGPSPSPSPVARSSTGSAAASPFPGLAAAPAWVRVGGRDLGLSLEVPRTAERLGADYLWAVPEVPDGRLGVSWNDITPGWEPLALLPNHSIVQRREPIELPWGVGTRYTLRRTATAAQGGGIEAAETHVIVQLGGKRAYDLYAIAPTPQALSELEPAYRHMLESVVILGG